MTTLTMRDEKRLKIIQRVFQGEVTVAQGALVLGVSERQCYRIKARVKKAGAKGVVHGNRGRPCQGKIKESTVRRIVELARGKYQDFNDHHLTEKLREEHKIKLSLGRTHCTFMPGSLLFQTKKAERTLHILISFLGQPVILTSAQTRTAFS